MKVLVEQQCEGLLEDRADSGKHDIKLVNLFSKSLFREIKTK